MRRQRRSTIGGRNATIIEIVKRRAPRRKPILVASRGKNHLRTRKQLSPRALQGRKSKRESLHLQRDPCSKKDGSIECCPVHGMARFDWNSRPAHADTRHQHCDPQLALNDRQNQPKYIVMSKVISNLVSQNALAPRNTHRTRQTSSML